MYFGPSLISPSYYSPIISVLPTVAWTPPAHKATIDKSVLTWAIGGRPRDLERPCRLDPLAARQIFTAELLRAVCDGKAASARPACYQWTRSTENPSVRAADTELTLW